MRPRKDLIEKASKTDWQLLSALTLMTGIRFAMIGCEGRIVGELTEERVASIVKDVMHRELTDPDSMFRLVLERAFLAWGKQLKAEIQEVIQPVSTKAEAALTQQQQQDSTKRLKTSISYALEIIVKILVIGAGAYGLFKFIQTH